MLKSIRKTLVGVLSVLTGAVLAVAILFSAGVFQGDSALSAYASEITVTPQTFGDGTVKHQKVNDMVGMSVSWGKKTYVSTTRRTIANNSLSSATVHSIWTTDAKNKNLAGSESYVKTGTFAGHANVKYYEIPGNSNKYNSSEAWKAAITAAMKEKNTYDTAQDSATYGEYTSWNYVLVRLAGDWTATEITGSYSWTQSTTTFKATTATSFEVDSGGKVVTYTSNNGDNLYNSATMGGLSTDDVPSAPFTHGRLGIPSNTYVILDLNGHTIDRHLTASADITNAYQYPSVFAVGTGARLEVFDGTATDSNPVGTGKLTGGNGNWSYNSYANENKGGAFHLADNSEVTLHSGTATGGSTCLGGAVYLLGNAIFNLYEGRLTGNTAHRGGAVYLAQGSYSVFNMYGGEISSCATLVNGASRGGAVCVYEKAFCNIYGGKICNNVAVWGGGISVDTNSYVKLYGGEISGNGAVKYDNSWGASGAGVNLLAESYGVYINGPATVKGNYTLKDGVLNKFRGVNGVGSQTVTAVENRMTMNITLELEGGGNKVLENYEVAGNLFLSKKNTNNVVSTKPTNSTLGYAEIKVQGVLSKGGKNAEVYVSPDGGTEGNHYGKIMRGFITSGYDDTQNQQNTGHGEVQDLDVWTDISGDEYQYTSYLCGNAVGNYFKSDSGADIIETLDSSNARWVEITDLTKARTADVTWEYYDGTELDGERLEENWKPFSDYPDNIPPSAVYDDETNWLERVRFVFNKFRDTDSNGYCDLMERFVVEYDGTDELFKYTKTTYRFKKGADTANNGDKNAVNYELDKEIPALVKSGAWIESSIVYCDGESETFEKGKVPKGGIKEAGTYTFSIGAAAKPGSSSADDTVFSPSDVLTDKLEKVQLKVAQRGLTVTGVAISKVYDGKVDVSEDLNNALASEDAATRIAPTITGGWLAQHYGQIRVASEEPDPFKGVILDSPDVGTHISTKFESLSLLIVDVDSSKKIARNYIVSGELSNITVDITPRVLKKEDFSWGGNSVEGDTDAEKNAVSFQWDSAKKFLTAVYTGRAKNPVITWADGAILKAESRDAADSVVLEYGGTQSVANSKPGGELFGATYQASAKITALGQGGNYVFARYNADGSLIDPFKDGKYVAENTTTTVEVEFRIEQAPLTVEKWNVSDNATTAWDGTEVTTDVGYYYNGNTPQSEVEKDPVILFPEFKGTAESDFKIGVADVQLVFGGNSAATPGGDTVTVKPQLKNQEGNYYIDAASGYFTLEITIEKRLVTVKVFDGTGVYGSNDRVAEHYTDYGLRTGVHLTENMGASKDWDYAAGSLEFLGSDAENILLCLDAIDTTGYDGANKDHWTAAKYAVAGSHAIKCQFINKTDLYEVVFLNSAGEAKDPKFEITPATITTGAIWTIEHVYKADGYPVEITADMITLCGDMKFADATIEYTQTKGTTLSPDGTGKYTAVEAGSYTFNVVVTVENHAQFTHELIIVISSEHVYISLGSDTINYTYGDEKLTRKILQALKDGTVGGVDAAYDDWLLNLVFTEKYITEISGFTAGADQPLGEQIKSLKGMVRVYVIYSEGNFGTAGYLNAGSYSLEVDFKESEEGVNDNRTASFTGGAGIIVVSPRVAEITWTNDEGAGTFDEANNTFTLPYRGAAYDNEEEMWTPVVTNAAAADGKTDDITVNSWILPYIGEKGAGASLDDLTPLLSEIINVNSKDALGPNWGSPAYPRDVGWYIIRIGDGRNSYFSSGDAANYTYATEDGKVAVNGNTYMLIKVAPAKLSVTWADTEQEFDGNALKPTVTFTIDGQADQPTLLGEDTFSLSYTQTSAHVESTLAGENENTGDAVNAGTYTVTLSTRAIANYAVEGNLTFTDFVITQKTVKVNWSGDETRVYDGTDQFGSIGATYQNAFGVTTRLRVLLDGAEAFKDVKIADGAVAAYVAKASFATELENNNYQFEAGADTKEFTINPYTVNVVWVEDDFTYNAKDQKDAVKAYYVGLEDGTQDDLTISFDGEFKDWKKEAYTFTAALNPDAPESKNYQLRGDATTCEYHIKKADYNVEGVQSTQTYDHYDGEEKGEKLVIGTNVKGVEADSAFTATISYSPAWQFTGAGNHIVTYTVSGNSNYNDYTGRYLIVINKAKIAVPVAAEKTYTYNGELQTFEFTTELNLDLLSVSNNEQTLANTYTVTVSIIDTENYEWAEDGGTSTKSYEWVVMKADYRLSELDSAQSYEYDGTPKGKGLTASPLKGTRDAVNVQYTYEGRPISPDPQDDLTSLHLVNVGKYTIQYSVSGSTNYNAKNGEFTVEITAKQLVRPTAGTNSFQYNGAEHVYTPDGYEAIKDFVTIDGNRQTDADTYDATVTLKPNCEWSTENAGVTNDVMTFTWTITQAEGEINVTGELKATYLTTEQTFDLYNYLTSTNNADLSFTLDEGLQDDVFIDGHTLHFVNVPDSGVIAIHVTLSAGRNHTGATATIEATFRKAASSIDVSGVVTSGYKYTAKEQSVDLSGVSYVGDGEKVFAVTGAADGKFVTEGGDAYSFTNVPTAGFFQFSISLKEGKNYSATTLPATITVIVEKAQYDLSGVVDQECVYNGMMQGAMITVGEHVKGLAGDKDFRQFTRISYGDGGQYQFDEVGVHTVTYSVFGNNNYEDKYNQTYTVTITKAKIELTDLKWNYGEGEAAAPFTGQEITVKIESGIPAGVSVEYSGNVTETNAGTKFTVTAHFTVNDNFQSLDDVTHTWEISPVAFQVTVPSETFTYNGSPLGADITVGGVKGDGAFATRKYTVSYSLGETSADSVVGLSITDWKAGGYEVSYKVTSEDGNYTDTTGSFTVTVEKAAYTVKAPAQTFTFSGVAQGNEITVTGVGSDEGKLPAEAAVSYRLGAGEWKSTVLALGLVNASEGYDVSYSVSGNPNYLDASGTFTVVIERAEYVVSNTEQHFTYNGELQGEKITVSGVADDGAFEAPAVTYTGFGAKPAQYSAAFTYTVSYSIPATDNYNAKEGSYTIEIAKATYIVTAADQTHKYDGTPQGENIVVQAVGKDTALVSYWMEGTPSASAHVLSVGLLQIVNYQEGGYTVHYSVAPNPNYKDVSDGTFKVMITKRTVKVNVTANVSDVYGTFTDSIAMAMGENWEYVPGSDPFVDADLASVRLTSAGFATGSHSEPTFQDVTSYTVTMVLGEAIAENYDFSVESKGTYTITPATIRTAGKFRAQETKAYTGEAVSIDIDLTYFVFAGKRPENAVIAYSFDANGLEYTKEGNVFKVTHVGTYVLTMTVTGKNHNPFTTSYTLILSLGTEIEVSLRAEALSVVYGDTDADVTDLVFETAGFIIGVSDFDTFTWQAGGDNSAMLAQLKEFITVTVESPVLSSSGHLRAGTYSLIIINNSPDHIVKFRGDAGSDDGREKLVITVVEPAAPDLPQPPGSDLVIEWADESVQDNKQKETITGGDREHEVDCYRLGYEGSAHEVFTPTVADGLVDGDEVLVHSTIFVYLGEGMPTWEAIEALIGDPTAYVGLFSTIAARDALWARSTSPKDAGWYMIVLGNASGEGLYGHDAGNYDPSVVSNPYALIEIKPREVTVERVVAQDKIYDGTTDVTLTVVLTEGGVVSGDSYYLTAEGAFESADVAEGEANVPVHVDSIFVNGTSQSNYTLPAGFDPKSLIVSAKITPRTVTVSGITAHAKEYDGSQEDAPLNMATALLEGVVEADRAFLTVSASGRYTENGNVGNEKDIAISALTLIATDAEHQGLLGNYRLDAASQNSAKGSIVPKQITVDAGAFAASDKEYDGTKLVALTYGGKEYPNGSIYELLTADQGLIGIDEVYLSASGNFDSANVASGSVEITVTLALTGADSANYTLTDATVKLTAQILQKKVTVTVHDQFTTYGESFTFDPDDYEVSGLIAGERLESYGTVTLSVAAWTDANLEGYDITGTWAPKGGVAENYSVTVKQGKLIVDKARGSIDVSHVTGTQYEYTGAPQTVTLGGVTFVGEGEPTYSTLTFTDVEEGNGKQITITLAESVNYYGATEQVTITVLPKKVRMTAPDDVTAVFDGKPHGASAAPTFEGIVDSKYTVYYVGDGSQAQLEAPTFTTGTHTVTLVFSSGNYVLEEGCDTEYTVTIAAARLTLCLREAMRASELQYDGVTNHAANLFEEKFMFTVDGEPYELNPAFYTVLWRSADNAESDVAVKAGTYALVLKIGAEWTEYIYFAESEEYGLEGAGTLVWDGALTVSKALMEIAEPAAVTGYYTGTAYGADAAVGVTLVSAADTYRIEYSADGALYSDQKPTFTEAGSYTVHFRVLSENYEDASGSYTVEISPAQLLVKSVRDGYDFRGYAYTDADLWQFVVVEGRNLLSSGDYEAVYTYDGEETGEVLHAGEYTLRVRVLGAEADNYEIAYEEGDGLTFRLAGISLRVTPRSDHVVYRASGYEIADLVTHPYSAYPGLGISYRLESGESRLTDAGHYVVHIVLEGLAERDLVLENSTLELTVLPAEIEARRSDTQEFVFGKSFGEDVAARLFRIDDGAEVDCGHTLEFFYEDASVDDIYNAGRYTVYVRTDATNYIFAEGRDFFVVDVQCASFTPVAFTGSTDGEAVDPASLVRYADEVGNPYGIVPVLGTDYEVRIYRDDVLVDEIREAGFYRVYFDGKGNFRSTVASVSFIIGKANRWATEYYRDDWAEGSTPSRVTNAVALHGGAATVKYYRDEACTVEITEEELATAKAGTYYAKYSVEATAEYDGLTGVFAFRITDPYPEVGFAIALTLASIFAVIILAVVIHEVGSKRNDRDGKNRKKAKGDK